MKDGSPICQLCKANNVCLFSKVDGKACRNLRKLVYEPKNKAQPLETTSAFKTTSLRFCAFGSLGSGKTLTLVKEAYRYSINHPESYVMSNIQLNTEIFVNFAPITEMKDFFHIDQPCFVLIDEAWSIADSRQVASPENKALGMILLRSRKKNWVVGFSQQWYTQLDLRIRFVTDVWIMPQFFPFNSVLQEDSYDIHANYLATRFYDGSQFFDLYRTDKDPLTLNIDEIEEEYEAKKERARGRRPYRQLPKQWQGVSSK